MDSYDFLAATQMLLRWIHVFAAILWIGQTYLFHLMERHLVRTPEGGAIGRMWMLHGGGYYQVEKRPFAAGMPEQLVWFKWESAVTWISGMLLLGLNYHMGGLMTEGDGSMGLAAGIGAAAIVLGWIVYDMLVRSPLGSRPILFAIVGFVLILLLHNGLVQVMSGRAAFIHVGAVIGTIMVANVWSRILPSQKKMLKAVRSGTNPDPELTSTGPLRSRHNSYVVLPLVLIMISNHYPTISYGSDYSTVILGAVTLAGWGVARLVLGAPAHAHAPGTSDSS
ncbi:MAG TPA: urate hydroxylase PuuD [Rhodothermales bacterium]|nr:urate hydroxylase PuuD [Rhodothermales bacterium]